MSGVGSANGRSAAGAGRDEARPRVLEALSAPEGVGHDWNHKRVYRLYCLLELNLRRRTKKRVPPRDPKPLVVPERPNQAWAADFMSDTLYDGVRFCSFNVLDDFNRETLSIEIDTSGQSLRF